MALYAFDGTWNKDEDGELKDTNVVKFRDAYQALPEQKLYFSGPGTRFSFIGKILGGTFGIGGKWRVWDAFDKFRHRYGAGDTTIDIVGFSRGSAIALDFANRIAKKGWKDPASGKRVIPKIRFLGLWDTVAAFGLAWNAGPLMFHDWNPGWDLKVPENVEHCYHALAIDEHRKAFGPTRNERAYEAWFRGYHSDIGGGKGNDVGRSAIALRWMMKKALACGVLLDAGKVAALDAVADPNAPLKKPTDIISDPPRKVGAQDRVHYTVDQCVLPSKVEISNQAPRETPAMEALA